MGQSARRHTPQFLRVLTVAPLVGATVCAFAANRRDYMYSETEIVIKAVCFTLIFALAFFGLVIA
jgi:hypothetical protein